MKPRPWADPVTGKDEPPPGIKIGGSVGEDWRTLPSAWWGPKDWERARMTNQPVGQSLPTPQPDRVLPSGFTLFPDRARETAGDRALREVRGARVESLLRKLGL